MAIFSAVVFSMALMDSPLPFTHRTRSFRSIVSCTGCIIQNKLLWQRWPNQYCPEQKPQLEKADSYPLITVVIPTYNRASLLKKAIGSVLDQTYNNLELIIADDGSTDDTKQVVGSIGDPRIKWIGLPHTGHIGNVRNAGARAGKGKWIAFLDSDDQWLSDKLELQLEAVKTTGKRWCYTNFELMNEMGMKIPPRAGSYKPLSGWITGQLLSNEATVIVCTLLLEKKLFDEIEGFSMDERLAFRGDYEFALRLSLKDEAVALPHILVKVLEHPGRATNSLPDAHERSAVPYVVFLEQNNEAAFRKIAKKRQAHLLAEAAVRRSATGDRRMALGQLVKAMGDDDWRHWLSAAYRSMKGAFRLNRKYKIDGYPDL